MNRGYGPVSYRRVEHRMHDQEVAVAERTATLHGHELSYVDSGSGPAVLFIHGLLGSHQNWAHLVDGWTTSHRLLAPDLFGHGGLRQADGRLLARLRTPPPCATCSTSSASSKVTLVGHSLGGGIAMQFCYLFPERVERLVLVASGGLGRAVSPLLRSATLPGAEWVLPVLASGWVRAAPRRPAGCSARVGWRPAPTLSQAWHGFTSLSDAESRRAFLATTRAVIDPGGQTVDRARPPADGLARSPTLVVWGTKDRMIPAWHAATAAKAIPELPGRAVRGRRALPAPRGTGPVRGAADRLHDRSHADERDITAGVESPSTQVL